MMLGELTNDQTGIWFLGLAAFVGLIGGILSCAVAIKKLMEAKRISDTYVTHGELDHFADNIEGKLTSLKEVMEKHEVYVHSRFHELTNTLATLPLQVKILAESYEKLERKIEIKLEHSDRVLAFLDRKFGAPKFVIPAQDPTE